MCQETAGGVRTTSHFSHENPCLQPLSDAMFILTTSGPNERRMLTLTIRKLNAYICALASFFFAVFEHKGAAASLSFKQLGRFGLFLLYVLHAAAAHQKPTQ